MKNPASLPNSKGLRIAFTALLFALLGAGNLSAWWNGDWGGRVKLTVNPAAEGAEIEGDPGDVVLLVRLHAGVLPFEFVQQDGSDLRFIDSDDKTPLSFHLEKFDPLMAEGFAWVRVPKASGEKDIWLYYGNDKPGTQGAPDPKKTYPDSAKLVYHLNERGTPPQDATTKTANAETAGSVSEGTIIGNGLRLVGREPIRIPTADSTAWSAGGEVTLVLWVKPMNTASETVLVSRPDAGGFKLGLAAGGSPFVEVNGTRAASPETVSAGAWRQIALTASAGRIALYLDGKQTATLDTPLPAGAGPIFLGGPDPAAGSDGRFVGELDEFQIYGAALVPAALRFGFITQSGSDLAGRVLTPGQPEGSGGGGGGMLEHVFLFGDIARNMMFDGWIAVAVCVVMMAVGWTVAVKKFREIGRMERGNAAFQELWGRVSSDLTALDLEHGEQTRSVGKTIDEEELALLAASPLYRVYHVGSDEITHRLAQDRYRGQGLRARSIQAIRAALDTALVHEQHRLNKGLTYLTISIAGGPYVGLLGTVVGVMITFAVIARSGEVDVNSIAPGIASALLATTVGLLVAIPALFMYSFLSARIKSLVSSMRVFIDEFVAKVAEFYPPPGEDGTLPPGIPSRGGSAS